MKRINYRGLVVDVEEVHLESPDIGDITVHESGREYRFRGMRLPNGRIKVILVIDGGDGIPTFRKKILQDLAGAILRDRL